MEVRCKYCNKLYALNLEGKLTWYCPKCKKYQTTVAEINNSLLIKEGYGKIV